MTSIYTSTQPPSDTGANACWNALLTTVFGMVVLLGLYEWELYSGPSTVLKKHDAKQVVLLLWG
eukprot:m.177757 g.177757  ORF g.177757 m.177757 type:complete len:64 (+) comp16823_c0_seq3:2418-2609(+)